MTTSPTTDPRIPKARRIVHAVAVVVGAILAGTAALGVYHLATDRPARELFFPPAEPPPDALDETPRNMRQDAPR